ncbi:hypothetical protein KHQ81_03965 [Mycoplasmatota bacterium]|nr:hypothetical protein KHQ81_03965 [Mycoplasmatota bacterium]
MLEYFNEEDQQYYNQFISERVVEIKHNKEELLQVCDSIIQVFSNDKDKSKYFKYILGDNHLKFIKLDDIKLIQKLSLELLIVLVKEMNDNDYNDIVMKLIENEVDQEIISHIEKCRAKQIKDESIIYFILNMISIIGAFLLYYLDYYKIDFIPILTQIIVIVASLRLNRVNAIKSGLLLTLLNFTLVLPLKDVIYRYDYQLTSFLFIGFILLGLISSILPNYLNKRFTIIKSTYRRFFSVFITSFLFTFILLLGNIYYTKSMNLSYHFNPLYKLIEPLFIAIISIQIVDSLKK